MTMKQSLQQHYRQQQLSDVQLQQLMTMQEVALPSKAVTTKQSLRRSALVSIAIIALFSGWFSFTQNSQSSVYQAIADEVVKNHRQLKPLEISSGEMSKVSAYFKQLPFIPRTSNNAQFDGRLMGGGGATAPFAANPQPSFATGSKKGLSTPCIRCPGFQNTAISPTY